MLYPSPIQLSHVYGPITHGVLQGGPKSEWRNTSFGDYEPSTVSVFLSVVKCRRVCRAQTYAHFGIEPSRLAKGFLQGGPNFFFLNRIFDHLQTLRISATVKNRGIQAAYYVAFFCAPWKSYVESEWRVCVSSTDALVFFILHCCYCMANKDSHYCIYFPHGHRLEAGKCHDACVFTNCM